MTELSNAISNGFLYLASAKGFLIAGLILIGVFAIISAIGQKIFEGLRYLFIIFVAIPVIIIIGLFNRDMRKERLKELGEIRAYAKEHPDKWKKGTYYVLFMLLFLFIIVIFYFIIARFVLPLQYLNEFSKGILNESINNSLINGT